MRLLKRSADGKISLVQFRDDNVPRYAILSHTWTESKEITFQDFVSNVGQDSAGYEKIRFCVNQAAADGIEYSWVDTCCIDKTTADELNTAINSMFRWYKDAAKCYVYLPDVEVPDEITDPSAYKITWANAFQRSRWFTRGWTLQELLAPPVVEFFTKEGKRLGSKISLEREIHEITSIPEAALRSPILSDFSVEERFRWTTDRVTTKPEDRAYCLFGIFGIFLPLIYGEGEKHALQRVRAEVQRKELGQVTATFADVTIAGSPSRSNKAPHNVPFPRDPDFIERPDLTDRLSLALAVPAARIALVGVGGVGKSQIAIDYCYTLRDASPQTWVFWIHASNAARYNEGVRDCLKLAKVDKRSDPNENVHVLFRDWLRSEDSGRWLIVIDNADEIDFLVERSNNEKSMFKQLPVCDHGTILITSRSRVSASKLVQPKEMIDIPPMREEQAVDLIEGRLGKDEDSAKLAAALDYMPLAISQAAAYIEQRGKRFSIQRYIEKIQKGDPSRKSILDENVEDLRRDEEARNAITLTWEISFEHIRRLRRSAADLLSLMSFFDRQAIPEVLLRVQRSSLQNEATPSNDENRAKHSGADDSGSSSGDESDTAEDDSFDKDIVMLKGFAFISTTTAEDSTFEMHRLVQRATQRWLQSKKQFDTWRAGFLYNLADVYPNGEFENWKVCQRLYPHVKFAVEMKPVHAAEELDQALICRHAGWYAFNMSWLGEAEELLVKAHEIFVRLKGEEDEGTLRSAGSLAILYDILGRSDEAENLQTKIVDARMRTLGADHSTTLVDMHNLAYSYNSQGRKEEAEQLFKKVIEAKRRTIGSEHAQTLQSLHGLAVTYSSQERWTEAEELFLKVIEARSRVLGPEHKDTLLSIARLSDVYFETKQWTKAEELMLRAVKGYEDLHGAHDLKTLNEFAFLAKVYHESGQHKKAEELRLRTIQGYEGLHGAQAAKTLEEVALLAKLYYETGQYSKAERLRSRTLQGYERVYGAKDIKTLAQKSCLGDIYFDSRQYARAEDLMVPLVQEYEEVLGAQSPKTLHEIAFLAKTYHASGKYAEAEELRLRTVQGYEEIYGAKDVKTLAQRACLADVYHDSEQYAKAEDLMIRIVQDYTELLGPQDPKTLSEVAFLAKVRRAREEEDPDSTAGQDRPTDCSSRNEQPSTDPKGSQSTDEQDAESDEASYTLVDRDRLAHHSPRDDRDSPTVSRSWRRRIRAKFGTKRPVAERP